jgi:hypothetical protein
MEKGLQDDSLLFSFITVVRRVMHFGCPSAIQRAMIG